MVPPHLPRDPPPLGRHHPLVCAELFQPNCLPHFPRDVIWADLITLSGFISLCFSCANKLLFFWGRCLLIAANLVFVVAVVLLIYSISAENWLWMLNSGSCCGVVHVPTALVYCVDFSTIVIISIIVIIRVATTFSFFK